MRKIFYFIAFCLCILPFQVSAESYEIVTASNDANNNMLLVYNAQGEIVQSAPTGGQGGVPPHIIGGGIAKNNNLLAVINYNSKTVSIFRMKDGTFNLMQMIPAYSKPVSVTFGGDHLYILGTTSIESHAIMNGFVEERPDGSAQLLIPDNSAAQVGFLGTQLIISQRSNMIELVDLQDGVVTNKINPVQLPPPPRNKVPVGLVTRGSTAYVTIAHSDEVGVVKDGRLMSVVSSENQHAPCWVTLLGPWVFCCNTPSKSISRYNVTENSIQMDELLAAQTIGEPTDIDAGANIIAVLELSEQKTYLSHFRVDRNGNLRLVNRTPTAFTANGVAVIDIRNNSNSY